MMPLMMESKVKPGKYMPVGRRIKRRISPKPPARPPTKGPNSAPTIAIGTVEKPIFMYGLSTIVKVETKRLTPSISAVQVRVEVFFNSLRDSEKLAASLAKMDITKAHSFSILFCYTKYGGLCLNIL